MMTTITSPAGETIEVVSDADFMEVFDVNPIDLRIWNPKRPLLEALWREGKAEDRKSGQATRVLWERMKRHGYRHGLPGLRSVVNGGAGQGMLERDLNGKRCYRIQLVRLPEFYLAKLLELEEPPVVGPPAPQHPTKVEAEPVVPAEPVPVIVSMPDVTEDVAAAVARELLAEVVRIITKRPESLEAAEIKERLANSLTYTEKLRRELREAGDELRAVKQERDALRHGLKIMESNFDKALGDNRRVVDEEVRKQMARLMSAKPTTKGDDQ